MTNEVEELPKSKIRFMRMSTGEDLVTEYAMIREQGEEPYYVFYNPMKVIYILQEDGKLTLSLGKWIFPKICEEQEFVVYPDDVITIGVPNKNIVDCYHKTLEKEKDGVVSYYPDASQVSSMMEMGSRDDLDLSDDELEEMSKLFSEYKKKNLH